MKKHWYTLPVLLLWLVLTAAAWLSPHRSISESERRPLAQLPALQAQTLLEGSFMEDFEKYTLDQFPLRDGFRKIKSLFHTYVLRQQDTNGIYLADGYAAKMEYPLNEVSVKHAIDRLTYLRENYLTGSRVFFAAVPDKGYYLAEASDRLFMDYDTLFKLLREGMPWAEHIDLTGSLSLADYYRTDTHWRQEKLTDTAAVLCQALGVTPPTLSGFTQTRLERPFYGVYYGQAALPMEPEELYLMESPLLEQCSVYDHETGKTLAVYDRNKLDSSDLYDVYLSGAKALLTVENPQGIPGKELIVFRDSFGSSMIPLILGDYAKVTLVDIRYISIDLLENFLDFSGQDVLMLYSTLILNNSSAIK